MAIISDLDQTYIDTQLRCPEGRARIEIVDPQRTGLYIEVRATKPGEGTYYLRYKEAGKTCHTKIGRTTALTLEEARKAVLTLKAALGVRKSPATEAVPAPTDPAAPSVQPTPTIPASSKTVQGIMSLDAFMTEYYFPYIRGRKRSAPRDDQLYRLRIKERFGHLPLGAIKRVEVERFGDKLVESGLSHASANQHMQLMRRICNLAVGWEYLDRNPLNGIKLFHLDNQRDTYLNDEEVERLVALLKVHKNRMVSMIVLFLLATGARLAEGLYAKWVQVDREKMLWKIPASNSKSKKAKHIPLNSSAMWVIDQLETEATSEYLFPSPASNKPYKTITRAFWVIRRKAKLPEGFRVHDLRHTFASRLVSAGMSLFDVQTLLGHADPRTSQRYAHLSNERAQKASNAAAFTIP